MRSSSGDRGAERCPYLTSWYWLEPSSWYWENERYTESAKEYLRKNLVEAARKEMDKKTKIDIVNWKIK
jgi:hypothetical protein